MASRYIVEGQMLLRAMSLYGGRAATIASQLLEGGATVNEAEAGAAASLRAAQEARNDRLFDAGEQAARELLGK